MKKPSLSAITLCILVYTNCIDIKAQNIVPQDDDQYKYFKTELAWIAKVTIAETISVGESKNGTRRVVPITGGTFEGPGIKGKVLNGGEDWQLVRPDGDTQLYARYLLQTDDSIVIQVINQVLIHNPEKTDKPTPYVRSVIDLEAPVNSKYDYLNHAIFLGTLTVPELMEGEEPFVIIGVYKLL